MHAVALHNWAIIMNFCALTGVAFKGMTAFKRIGRYCASFRICPRCSSRVRKLPSCDESDHHKTRASNRTYYCSCPIEMIRYVLH